MQTKSVDGSPITPVALTDAVAVTAVALPAMAVFETCALVASPLMLLPPQVNEHVSRLALPAQATPLGATHW